MFEFLNVLRTWRSAGNGVGGRHAIVETNIFDATLELLDEEQRLCDSALVVHNAVIRGLLEVSDIIESKLIG